MSVSHYDFTAPAPVVSTRAGKVQGRWQNASSAAYLGIPFAEPPIGDLRFAEPKPFHSWEGVRPAYEYGPTPQRRPFGPVVTIPEPSIPGECTLNVNVFTPAPNDKEAHLPVLAWIHGGGYFAGSPSSAWYNGQSFNANGVVTVSISYRLGFDGFGWIQDAPMNRGLRDQIAALQWIQENIESFGGDPKQVTIAGQSAGGGSVLTLLASPQAQGLFRSVISESGAFGCPTLKQAQAVGISFAKEIGIEPTIEEWRKISPTAILDREREFNSIAEMPSFITSSDDLLSQIHQGHYGEGNLAFAPSIDGEVLTQSVFDSYRNAIGRDVCLLMGSTHNEFSYPMPSVDTLETSEHAFINAGVSPQAVKLFSHEINRIGEDRLAGQLTTSYMFHIGIVQAARCRNSSGSGAKTWLYEFGQLSSISNASLHCDDIPYFFNVLDDPKVAQVLGVNPSQSLADHMHTTWIDFIADGKLDFPSVQSNPHGALRFLGNAKYNADAYLFEDELIQLNS